jgi:hypothetical protein
MDPKIHDPDPWLKDPKLESRDPEIMAHEPKGYRSDPDHFAVLVKYLSHHNLTKITSFLTYLIKLA